MPGSDIAMYRVGALGLLLHQVSQPQIRRLATPKCLSIAKRGAQLGWPELSSRRPRDWSTVR
jgi:hypothetical protein